MIEIVLEGPAKNALGTATLKQLLDRLREAAGAPVLLTGAGDAFSSGLDLREVAALSAAGAPTFLRLLEHCMATLYLYPGPTVAAVNGHAIAGGCVLAVCCDHRVATRSAKVKIGLNEVPLGVRFPPRTLAIVRARVPRTHETRLLLGGALLAPDAALEAGLVDELADDPVPIARERLATLARSPAAAYALTKRDLRGAHETDLASDEVLATWLGESVGIWSGPDLKARIAAALAGRAK